MSDQLDIRWKQRLQNYLSALQQLEEGVRLFRVRPLSNIEKQGLIQAFEFTHELAWNVMKDYFEFQGTTSLTGSRDAIREAFRRGIVDHGELWMDMIRSRNLSTHTYNEATAELIIIRVVDHYLTLFQKFAEKMEEFARV